MALVAGWDNSTRSAFPIYADPNKRLVDVTIQHLIDRKATLSNMISYGQVATRGYCNDPQIKFRFYGNRRDPRYAHKTKHVTYGTNKNALEKINPFTKRPFVRDEMQPQVTQAYRRLAKKTITRDQCGQMEYTPYRPLKRFNVKV